MTFFTIRNENSTLGSVKVAFLILFEKRLNFDPLFVTPWRIWQNDISISATLMIVVIWQIVRVSISSTANESQVEINLVVTICHIWPLTLSIVIIRATQAPIKSHMGSIGVKYLPILLWNMYFIYSMMRLFSYYMI